MPPEDMARFLRDGVEKWPIPTSMMDLFLDAP